MGEASETNIKGRSGIEGPLMTESDGPATIHANKHSSF